MDYKVSVEDLNEVDRKILIEIPREVYNDHYSKRLNRAISGVQLKGFRRGRAPKAMVDKMIGDKIHVEVMEHLVSDAVRDALIKHDLNIVGTPQIDIDDADKEGPMVVRADVSIFPQPEVKDYFGVEFEVSVRSFDESQIEQQLANIRAAHAKYEPIEGREVVEEGDWVMVDYEGEFEGRKMKREGEYLPTTAGEPGQMFRDRLPDLLGPSLIGAKVGAECEAEINLPPAPGQEGEGEESTPAERLSTFKVNVRGVYRRELPELNDEFVKTAELADDFNQLVEKIREGLQRQLKAENDKARREALFEALVDRIPFTAPQALIDREIRYMLMEMKFLDPRDQRSYSVDVSRFRDALSQPAENRFRRGIILSKILEQEAPEITDEAVSEWLDKLAEEEGYPRAQLESAYGYPEQMPRLKELVAETKVVELLLERASIKEVAIENNAGGN